MRRLLDGLRKMRAQVSSSSERGCMRGPGSGRARACGARSRAGRWRQQRSDRQACGASVPSAVDGRRRAGGAEVVADQPAAQEAEPGEAPPEASGGRERHFGRKRPRAARVARYARAPAAQKPERKRGITQTPQRSENGRVAFPREPLPSPRATKALARRALHAARSDPRRRARKNDKWDFQRRLQRTQAPPRLQRLLAFSRVD